MFTVRRMVPRDKAAITDIASRIWDGTDYLPLVFDEWVEDRVGEFAAVELDGRVVGCAKLTFLTETDAWLEGLRKDPRVEEGGLARAVTRHLLAGLATKSGLTSVRFSTYMENRASISANEEMGFRRRATLSRKALTAATPLRPEPAAASAAAPAEVRVVREETLVRGFLDRSGYIEASGGLLVDGWHALPMDRTLLLSRFINAGLCRGVARGSRLVGLSISRIQATPGRTDATIACLDAEDDETADALFDDIVLRLRAAGEEPAARGSAALSRGIEWMMPGLPRLLGWSRAWGLESEIQEDDFFVYELPLVRLRDFREASAAPGSPLG